MAPSSEERRSCSSKRCPSRTVSRLPRTLTSPSTASGTPGIRVAERRGRISRTIPAGAAQITSPIRKMTAWSAGELAISIEETKIAQGVWAGNQFFATRCNKCRAEIIGPFRGKLKWCSAHRMAECQSSRVKSLPGCRALHQLSPAPGGSRDSAASATAIHWVAQNRVPNMLQVDPDLVGTSGVQLEPEQVNYVEAGDHAGIRPSRPPAGGDRHT